ncbi:hypothetical protein [Streptomyces sp. PTD9-10]|uniref:hypothetical protein n=1 Tax=Streptomyces sp. PTD9-10 TaxID=3120151 RepID=UPI00300B8A54
MVDVQVEGADADELDELGLGLATSTVVPSGPIVVRFLVAMSVFRARAGAGGSRRESMPGESASPLVQRNPFNRLLGQLHDCLENRRPFDEFAAFPPSGEALGSDAA